MALLPRMMVGIALLDHHGGSCDVGWLGIGMVEKNAISLLDLISEQVPRLVISDSFPARGLALGSLEILDRED